MTKPGTILEAYSRFHGYSLGNRIAALFQCLARGIQPGTIATFPRWIALGRHVKRGEKALTLCQPVTVKDRRSDDVDIDAPEATKTVFIWRPHWFVLSQTDGEPFVPEPLPAWDRDRALTTLEVSVVPFEALDGNTQGYARAWSIAINPVAQLPAKTTFHELAHVLLGHTAQGVTNDGTDLPRDLREAEAEAVALLCLESLELPGGDYCRGYIQTWLGSGRPIPEASAQRIFKAADSILRAGCAE